MASHKILVIDDSKVIQKTVKGMLPPGNFEILEAKDGEEGLKLIKQAKPNLIMLDFLLPKVSGWDVFQKIQATAEFKKIPLVVMSGRKEEVTEKIPEPFDKFFFAFLEKPFEKKDLMDAIKLAMAMAKKRPDVSAAAPAAAAPAAAVAAGGDDVAAMKAQMAKMQAEIDTLKKQVSQIITLIKQKLK